MASRRRPAGRKKRRSGRRGVLPAVLLAMAVICAAVAVLFFFNTPERRLSRALSSGARAMEEGAYIEAMNAYRSALDADPASIAAYEGLVNAAGAYGDAERVITVYREAVAALGEELPQTLTMATSSRLTAIGESFFSGGDYVNTRQVVTYLRELDDAAAERLSEKVIEVLAPPVGSSFNESGITWYVLERQGNRILIVAKEAVETLPFTQTQVGVAWGQCTLRSHLNREWINEALSAEFRARIVTMPVENAANPYDTQTRARAATEDAVFLLSVQEIEAYFPSEAERATGAPYWTRTPAGRSDTGAVAVSESGAFETHDVRDTALGVRPALWYRLE